MRMKTKVFSVYDSKAEMYLKPMHLNTTAEALRAFQDAVNNQETSMYHHPEDYTLFHLGEWDNSTGVYKNNQTPVSLGVAVEFKHPEFDMSNKEKYQKEFFPKKDVENKRELEGNLVNKER